MWEAWVAAGTRAVHVLAMSVLVGMPALVSVLARRGGVPVRGLLAMERIQWTAFGVIVLTGIGNAGWLAAGWAQRSLAYHGLFLAKLTAVVLLLCLASIRSFALLRQKQAYNVLGPGRLLTLYDASAVLGGVIAAAGLTLAHGPV